jgi:hypothetical protein
MAVASWLTNRGKLLLLQGQWDDAGATAIRMGLVFNTSAALQAAIDTEAEIQDIATVTDFLALTGVDEPTGGWYSRKNLSRTNAAQDDTNNRVNLVVADVTWTAAAVNGSETHISAAFWYDATTDTNDTTRQLMGVITFTGSDIKALNGSDYTLDFTNIVQAS